MNENQKALELLTELKQSIDEQSCLYGPYVKEMVYQAIDALTHPREQQRVDEGYPSDNVVKVLTEDGFETYTAQRAFYALNKAGLLSARQSSGRGDGDKS